ncbi:MAG: nitroreductase/quinone reductase family protein [Anaerolineales bacterium]
MKDFFIKLFMFINTQLIRFSKGKVGSKLGTQTILVLHTIGRKSGEERAIPIAYFEYENKFLIVASNWGKDQHASWYLNLKKNPSATLEVNGKTISTNAREAEGDEYVHLWGYVTKLHPPYNDYQKSTARRIPIMIFEPIG